MMARFGNGMYAGSMRVFTDKREAMEFLQREWQHRREEVKKYANKAWAAQWDDFGFFVRHIGYKYYLGTLNTLEIGDDKGPKNIPTNKFYKWITNESPL